MENRLTTTAEFEAATRRFISSRELLRPGATVIVALSGGADSVALLAVLTALGYDCRAAHCNYHLRGDESNRDMHHARQVAAALDAEFCLRHFDMDAELASHPGESLEMACRRVRYQWFSELADRASAAAVAVGHHCEDRTETFLLNLVRGAGIVGLTSMNARNAEVVRPLLWASRTLIEQYLALRGLEFVTDSTNAGTDFVRNRIRNRVLPYLEAEFPGIGTAILRSISNLESVRTLLMKEVERAESECTGARGEIDLRKLAKMPEASTLLLEMLRGKGFTPTQAADMLRAASGSGKVFHGGAGVVAEIDRGVMTLRQDAGADIADGAETVVDISHDISTPLRIRVSSHRIEEFRIPGRNANVAYVDADFALDPSAVWTVRHWRRGDRIRPFGATKSKLVSDIFAAAHCSAADKRKVWLLLRNGETVWIPGLRNSALGSIGPETHRFLRLEFLESEQSTH